MSGMIDNGDTDDRLRDLLEAYGDALEAFDRVVDAFNRLGLDEHERLALSVAASIEGLYNDAERMLERREGDEA